MNAIREPAYPKAKKSDPNFDKMSPEGKFDEIRVRAISFLKTMTQKFEDITKSFTKIEEDLGLKLPAASAQKPEEKENFSLGGGGSFLRPQSGNYTILTNILIGI